MGYAQKTVVQVYMAMKTGRSMMPVRNFRAWAKNEGVTNAVSIANNNVLGMDIGINVFRTAFNFSLDYDLGSKTLTKPYSSLVLAGTGYYLYQSTVLDVGILANTGVGSVTFKFRGNPPPSFTILSYHSPEAYTRSIVWVGQPCLHLNIKPQTKAFNENLDDERALVVLTLRAGVNLPIATGRWKYGTEYDFGGNDYRFLSTPVDVPKFYRSAWFVQVGLGFMLESRQF
jgi:hypothetical protein